MASGSPLSASPLTAGPGDMKAPWRAMSVMAERNCLTAESRNGSGRFVLVRVKAARGVLARQRRVVAPGGREGARTACVHGGQAGESAGRISSVDAVVVVVGRVVEAALEELCQLLLDRHDDLLRAADRRDERRAAPGAVARRHGALVVDVVGGEEGNEEVDERERVGEQRGLHKAQVSSTRASVFERLHAPRRPGHPS